jgi:hypothetical protein
MSAAVRSGMGLDAGAPHPARNARSTQVESDILI